MVLGKCKPGLSSAVNYDPRERMMILGKCNPPHATGFII